MLLTTVLCTVTKLRCETSTAQRKFNCIGQIGWYLKAFIPSAFCPHIKKSLMQSFLNYSELKPSWEQHEHVSLYESLKEVIKKQERTLAKKGISDWISLQDFSVKCKCLKSRMDKLNWLRYYQLKMRVSLYG